MTKVANELSSWSLLCVGISWRCPHVKNDWNAIQYDREVKSSSHHSFDVVDTSWYNFHLSNIYPLNKKRKVSKLISDTAFPNQLVWCMLLTKKQPFTSFWCKAKSLAVTQPVLLLTQLRSWIPLTVYISLLSSQLVLKLTSCQYNHRYYWSIVNNVCQCKTQFKSLLVLFES